MEFSNFENVGSSNSGFQTTQQNVEHAEWTFEENKLFENALAEFDPNSPGFFENVASRVPWKSLDEIKTHYQSLVDDVEMIENGQVPIPDYESYEQIPVEDKKTKNHHPRKKGVPWTDDEHQLFLMGLNKYGKGDWKSISRNYVASKTATQVASHAQKYFRRLKCNTPAEKRRPSIHDVQTVRTSFTNLLARRIINNASSFINTNEPLVNAPSNIPGFNNNNNYSGFAAAAAMIPDGRASSSYNASMMMNQQPPAAAAAAGGGAYDSSSSAHMLMMMNSLNNNSNQFPPSLISNNNSSHWAGFMNN